MAGVWRDRAGRGIGSDYTAMERSTSQSGGERKYTQAAAYRAKADPFDMTSVCSDNRIRSNVDPQK
jgi:hypothetical protein